MLVSFFVILPILALVDGNDEARSGYNIVEKLVHQCTQKDDIFKCLKIQAVKVANRAVNLKNFTIFDGVSFVSDDRETKSFKLGLNLNDTKLENLDSEELDDLLTDSSARFFRTHQLEIQFPKFFSNTTESKSEVEEARRKRRRGGSTALYWALAIKGTFLAMAYKGIAAMSGMALMMGKMALLLTAILGLKKLVNNGQESTTIEIIKKPKVSESHTYSNSYEDDYSHSHKGYDRGDQDVSRTTFKTYLN